LQGTGGVLSAAAVFVTGAVFIVAALMIALLCKAGRVKYMLPIGCAAFIGSKDFSELYRTVWPLQAAFLGGAAGLCAAYYIFQRGPEGGEARRKTTAIFLAVVISVGAGLFFARDGLAQNSVPGTKRGWSYMCLYERVKGIPNARAFLRGYQDERDKLYSPLETHAWSNMPGKTLVYYMFYKAGFGLNDIAAANIILCALAGIPLYFVVKRLASARVAAGACVLFYLLPAPPCVFPALNATTVLLALLGLWLMLVCLDKRDPAWGLGTGYCLGLLFLYEPSPFVLALALIPFIARAFKENAAATGGMFAGLVVGFAAVFVGLYLYSGVSVFRITADTVRCVRQFNEINGREYWPFVVSNVGEFGSGIGMAVFMLWMFGVGASVREVFGKGASFVRRLFLELGARPAAFVLMFFLTVAALDFWGTNRAEVTRLWLFLMPLAGACAIWAAEKMEWKNYMPWICGLVWAEAVLSHVPIST
jgi:hypothetical protein